MGILGKDPAAWSAGHPELGVPESGVQSARSIDGAKTACHFWVFSKGRLPSPTEESKGSEEEASVKTRKCPRCHGRGYLKAGKHTTECSACGGQGRLLDYDPQS